MIDWYDRILREFPPSVHRLTLVDDADGLLAEEHVQARIRERGFDIVHFDDSVAFRHTHESIFRPRWEGAQATGLVVVFNASSVAIPFDLLQAGHRVALGLRELFPGLSHAVVAAMDRADLDALHAATEQHAPGVLGDDATKDFALRHVYGIVPEAVVEPHDLLRVLLRLHYAQHRVPPIIGERLIVLLRQGQRFADWPLDSIVFERASFFAFLQARWPAFVNHAASTPSEDRVSAVAKPALLPFDHPDVRVYIDNLFVEGHLQPISHPRASHLVTTWLRFGVQEVAESTQTDRVKHLIDRAESALPGQDGRYNHWLRFARIWGELLAATRAVWTDDGRLDGLQQRIDAAFGEWLTSHYAGLASLPPVPPVMLHHVPRALAREAHDGKASKVALVVLDGLSLDQWVVVRHELARQRPHYEVQQDAVFAWIPTVTAVSRQAAFAALPPMYFPDSIETTAREPTLWRRFWAKEGVLESHVAYAKGLGSGNLAGVTELIGRSDIRVVGLVVDTVDKIMHGMALGARGMHNQARQWAVEGFLAELLDLLVARGFHIYLTSDHGNIEARGCGRPAEGVVADMRGERVRVYPDEALRQRWHDEFPDATAWPSPGLPAEYHPLLAPGRSAFVRESERIVCHGGACIEEVIVPLVRIAGRRT